MYFLVKAVKMNTNWVIVKSDFNFFLPFLVDCWKIFCKVSLWLNRRNDAVLWCSVIFIAVHQYLQQLTLGGTNISVHPKFSWHPNICFWLIRSQYSWLASTCTCSCQHFRKLSQISKYGARQGLHRLNELHLEGSHLTPIYDTHSCAYSHMHSFDRHICSSQPNKHEHRSTYTLYNHLASTLYFTR